MDEFPQDAKLDPPPASAVAVASVLSGYQEAGIYAKSEKKEEVGEEEAGGNDTHFPGVVFVTQDSDEEVAQDDDAYIQEFGWGVRAAARCA